MKLSMCIRCSTCGTCINEDKKFNSRKGDAMGETYSRIQIFHFKCTKCSAEITFKADPRNSDYVVESGAACNFEPWRDEEVTEKAKRKGEKEEMSDAMKSLENRAIDSKQDMDILSAPEEMKSMKSRHATMSIDFMLQTLRKSVTAKVFLFLLWGSLLFKVDSFGLQNDVKLSHQNIVTELPCSQKYLTGYFYEKHGQILESDFQGLAQEVGSDELSRSPVHSLNDVFGFSEVHRYLIGEGSHRRLVTNFKLNIKPDDMSWLNNHYCEVVVIERLPNGIFADPFELQHLVEHQVFLDVAVFGDTNLELPSALSNKSIVEVHMNTARHVLSRQSEITIELPLHARYPPLDVAGYSKIEFDQPDLLMRCKPPVTQLDFCSWMLSGWSDNTHKNGIFWLVPSGNMEHTTLVSGITFISALAAALSIVLSVICCSTEEDTKTS